MNGRVYDSRIGRFLQVDPFVQEPGNAQNHNRYTYLWNNPLNATDPSGFIGIKERQWAAVVVAVVAFYFCPACSASVYGAAATGAVVGGIATGSWKGALYGAFSSALTFGIFNASGGTVYTKALAVASSGGVLSSLQGGSFGNAFLSAGVSALAPGAIGSVITDPTARIIASVIVGGSISAATGGKFANGAVTAAFSYAVASNASRTAAGQSNGNFEADDLDGNRCWTCVKRNQAFADSGAIEVNWTSWNRAELNISVALNFEADYSYSVTAGVENGISNLSGSYSDGPFTYDVTARALPGPVGRSMLTVRPPAVGSLSTASAQVGGSVIYVTPGLASGSNIYGHEFLHNAGLRHSGSFTQGLTSYHPARSMQGWEVGALVRAYGR